jgi:glycosyltransferase involved in cell wall biosynthesis
MACAARAAGLRVTVVARYDRHRAVVEAAGLHTVPLPWRRGSLNPLHTLGTVSRLTQILRQERPDIVHAIALKPVIVTEAASRLAGVPYVVHAVTGMGHLAVAEGTLAQVLRSGISGILRGAGRRPGVRFLVENHDHAHDLAARGIARPERIVRVTGAGVDLARFYPAVRPDSSEVTVALVARMIAIKGIETAVTAVCRLADSGVPLRLLLAGDPDPDNPGALTAERLRQWAQHPAIDWLGRVDDIPALWSRCDIALLPALGGDGLPKSLLEAAACGRPIITTNTPGCRESLIDGETGLLVPPGDPDALAAALRILVEDPTRRRHFGCAARRLAEQHFSEDAVAQRVLTLYAELLAHSA